MTHSCTWLNWSKRMLELTFAQVWPNYPVLEEVFLRNYLNQKTCMIYIQRSYMSKKSSKFIWCIFSLLVVSFKTDFFEYLIKCSFWLTFKGFFQSSSKRGLLFIYYEIMLDKMTHIKFLILIFWYFKHQVCKSSKLVK